MTYVHTARHHGLLGTVIELRVEADTESIAAGAELLVISEIERLEEVFSVFRPASELSRWRAGYGNPSPELTAVLAEALFWRERSGGAYNPEVGVLTELWVRSAATGVRPDPDTLSVAVAAIDAAGYAVGPAGVRVKRPQDGLSLNAIAKGWIVDRATRAALDVEGVTGAMVNAGGDLLNLGSEALSVGIEDPFRTYDNIAPIATVEVEPGMALATSGGARRGWKIGDVWYSHVIDPRCGEPVGHVASATVAATAAVDADVLATILTVLQPRESLELVESLPDVSCYLITSDEGRHASSSWHGCVVS